MTLAFWWLGFKSDGAAAKRNLTCSLWLSEWKVKKMNLLLICLLFFCLYGSDEEWLGSIRTYGELSVRHCQVL